MQVARKRPGERWGLVEIDNTLEALQNEVDGEVEMLNVTTDAYLVFRKPAGHSNTLPFNINFGGLRTFGTILLVGVRGKEFTDTPAAGLRLFVEGRRKNGKV